MLERYPAARAIAGHAALFGLHSLGIRPGKSIEIRTDRTLTLGEKRFAGLNAAVSARLAGAEVLVMDKGRPGYSGLSPWPSSFRWFDPARGDEEEAYIKAITEGGDYISKLNWYRLWMKESKAIRDRLMDWGILAQYPKASEAGDYARNKCNAMVLGRVRGAVYGVPVSDGSEIQDMATANYTRRGGSRAYQNDPEETRSGKMSTPVGRSDLAGAATGMCCTASWPPIGSAR